MYAARTCIGLLALSGQALSSDSTPLSHPNPDLIPLTLYDVPVVDGYSTLEANLIGKGYDSVFSELKHAACVELKKTEAPLGIPKVDPSVKGEFLHIKDDYDFSSKSEIGVAASYNWGGGNGDAASKYIFENKFSSFQSYAMQTVEVAYPEQAYDLSKFRISKFGRDILKSAGGVDLFRYVCGDRFIIGLERGGSFRAIIRASSSTTEEQRDLEQSLAASSGGASMNATMKQRFESLRANSRLHIEVLRNGLDDSLPALDLNELASYTLAFPKKLTERGDQIPVRRFISADYATILLASKLPELGPTPEWGKRLGSQLTLLRKLATYRADLVYVRENKDQFVRFNEPELHTRITSVSTLMDDIIKWAHECVRSKGVTCPEVSAAALSVPSYAPMRAGPWRTVEPSVVAPQPIGESQAFPLILESKGSWKYGNSATAIHPITFSTRIELRSANNGSITHVPTELSVRVAPYTNVYFQFLDTSVKNYTDNAIYPPDLGQVRLGGDVDAYVSIK